MKRSSAIIFCMLALALVFPGCGGGGGSTSKVTPPADNDAATTNVSHDGTSGSVFGTNTDQIKRYQTFIADGNQTITGIEVKIRKTDIGTYNDVTVELYDTDTNHQPANILATAAVDTGSLGTDFTVLSASLSFFGLVEGNEYAIVLSQAAAGGSFNNAGYEWCAEAVSPDYYFGKHNGTSWSDESTLGDGWLIVSVDTSSGTNPIPGSLDTGFGTDGIVTTAIGSSSDRINSVSIQADGKIVAAGQAWNGSNYDFALARYNTDGTLDNTFGTDGMVITAIGTGINQANAVLIQADGKIVAAGYSYNGSDIDFALARYNTDGSLDTSFGTNGAVTTAIGTGAFPTASDSAVAISIQTDGKIVAAGYAYNGSNTDFALARYNTDGSLDTSFSTDGIVTTAIGAGSNASAISIQTDGKIVAAGYSKNGGYNDFALARYNTDGTLDTTFNADGKVTTAIGTGNDEAHTVSIQADGKIVAAGQAWKNGSNYNFALARYNTDGSLDTSFGTDGIVSATIGTNSDFINAVSIQADGTILAAGASTGDFALARYWP